MRRTIARVCLCLSCAVALLSTADVAQAIPRYALTDLGDLPGDADSSRAFGINNYGQVVGSSLTSGGRTVGDREVGTRHAFLWTPYARNGRSGIMSDLGTLPPTAGTQGTSIPHYSEAMGINDRGQVVGYSGLKSFLWAPMTVNAAHGTMIDVGFPGPFSAARAVNNYGQVLGTSEANVSARALLWTRDVERRTSMGDLVRESVAVASDKQI